MAHFLIAGFNLKRSLDTSAATGRSAGRFGEAPGTGWNTPGSDGAGRNEFFNFPGAAWRTLGGGIIDGQYELFKRAVTFAASVLIDGHFIDSLKSLLYFWQKYRHIIGQVKHDGPVRGLSNYFVQRYIVHYENKNSTYYAWNLVIRLFRNYQAFESFVFYITIHPYTK